MNDQPLKLCCFKLQLVMPSVVLNSVGPKSGRFVICQPLNPACAEGARGTKVTLYPHLPIGTSLWLVCLLIIGTCCHDGSTTSDAIPLM